MTSRIQEDGTGGEAKWADIDDDEDDWAPETIEWNDGTKVTLAHTESSLSTTARDKDAIDAKDTKEKEANEPVTKGTSENSCLAKPNLRRSQRDGLAGRCQCREAAAASEGCGGEGFRRPVVERCR